MDNGYVPEGPFTGPQRGRAALKPARQTRRAPAAAPGALPGQAGHRSEATPKTMALRQASPSVCAPLGAPLTRRPQGTASASWYHSNEGSADLSSDAESSNHALSSGCVPLWRSACASTVTAPRTNKAGCDVAQPDVFAASWAQPQQERNEPDGTESREGDGERNRQQDEVVQPDDRREEEGGREREW